MSNLEVEKKNSVIVARVNFELLESPLTALTNTAHGAARALQ